MMDWTPPPPLACSLTPIHAPTPRYAAMLATCFVLTVVGVPGQLSAQTVEDTETRPNILVFVSDDMGWGQPGFNGGTVVLSLDVIRVGDWKLLEEDGEFAKSDKSSPLQLYNIAEDPYETMNLREVGERT